MPHFEEQVEAAFQGMTDSQKRVAQFFIRHPEEVAFLNLEEVAARAEVSTTTVLRFARSIGYGGYSELQAKLQERVRAKVGLPQRLSSSSMPQENDIFTRSFARDLENLQTTMQSLSRDTLQQVVDKLIAAASIFVIGVRSSYCLSFFAASVLGQILGRVNLLHHGGGMLPEQVLNISSGDVLLAFSFPRYTKVTIDVAKQAKKQGAQVVAVTDSPISPIAEYADFVLPCEYEGILFKNSPVAPLSITNGLIAAVASKAKDRSMSNLSRGESLLKEWDYLIL